ncbi:MAG: transcriptional regulator, partial [Methanosarcinales archaeon]|nr:transcriptional regulator [Methanosarcinales archaeon]
EVQAAVFAGNDKTTFLDIKVFKGTLFDVLSHAEIYISERMNWKVEFMDFKRVEIPEIPIAAIREALVNSLCHRDYFRAESNKIAIFKNRIKIYNPGEFPSGFEPSDFIHGDAESVQRNPLISEILYYSKDIERWGSGIRRIYEECANNSVKVDFKKEMGGFSTTFYRTPAELTEKGVEKGVEKLTEKEQIILKLIIENAKISKEEMEHQGNLTKKSIEYNIRKLKDKGLLRRVGPARGGYWEVVDK